MRACGYVIMCGKNQFTSQIFLKRRLDVAVICVAGTLPAPCNIARVCNFIHELMHDDALVA